MTALDHWVAQTADGREWTEQAVADISPWVRLMEHCRINKTKLVALGLRGSDLYLNLPNQMPGYWQAKSIRMDHTGQETKAAAIGWFDGQQIHCCWYTRNPEPIFWEETRSWQDQAQLILDPRWRPSQGTVIL